MDIVTILSLVISTLVFLYAIFRDNTSDTEELKERVSVLETNMAVQGTLIERVSDEVNVHKNTLKALADQMHELDIKLERVLTILEK
ncbi:TPA: hypothetical protein QCK11_004733 [Enterobacter asburiae]|nr:hypothetical protein [Enterobacter asburiae]HDR2799077.1 hypothetical protein [Enterobacter asburiae]HDR2864702.1 hypothetical protein [Enterobacter asburiae]